MMAHVKLCISGNRGAHGDHGEHRPAIVIRRPADTMRPLQEPECVPVHTAVRETGAHMAIMEGIDLEIQSWFVDPSEIEFCRRPDGSDWLLGEGSYGKVGLVWFHN